MSYDIELKYDDEIAQVDNHEDGGTYQVGGSTEAWLNITWNYAEFYYEHLDADLGIRWLYGKTGRETEERLAQAVVALGTTQHHDYWEPTRGNAGYALNILLGWARQHPDAVWSGD